LGASRSSSTWKRPGVADLAPVVDGTDAVVFAAGAGPGSGAARKDTVDRAAAVLLADAAQAARVRRYLLVSSTGVDDPPRRGHRRGVGGLPGGEEGGRGGDQRARAGLDDPSPGAADRRTGHGPVLLAPPPVERADVTRDDTAAVLLALLDAPATTGRVLELRAGDTDIREGVRRLSA
jgi:uncharacterized protein YbjT (DUF2867 family)